MTFGRKVSCPVCWPIAGQHQCVLLLPSAFAGGAYEGKLANPRVRGAWFERKARAERREDGDTVKWLLDTVIRALGRLVVTVIGHQNMHFSLSDPCREPSTPGIAAKQPWAVLSNVTVDLSVSSRFEAGARRAFPLSGACLLTIEWE